MENTTGSQQTVNNVSFEQELVNTKSKRFNKIMLAVIIFFILGLVTTLFFLTQNKKSKSNPISITKQISVTVSPTKPVLQNNEFETEKTKKALSLEVPDLYPSVKWQEESTDAIYQININSIVLDKPAKIVLLKKGHLWKSLSPEDGYRIEDYYSRELIKKNWTSLETNENLEFNSFNLSSNIAGGVCDDVLGSIGYKEGFVRIVAIRREIKPCIAPDILRLSPIPSVTKPSIYYEVYISDPTPLGEIKE
jgi:hypothetical protein